MIQTYWQINPKYIFYQNSILYVLHELHLLFLVDLSLVHISLPLLPTAVPQHQTLVPHIQHPRPVEDGVERQEEGPGHGAVSTQCWEGGEGEEDGGEEDPQLDGHTPAVEVGVREGEGDQEQGQQHVHPVWRHQEVSPRYMQLLVFCRCDAGVEG